MKRTLLTTLALAMICWGALAQNVNIPDANFKTCLLGNPTINTNNDGEIQVSEASAFTGIISCNALNISDLTGIEAFTSVTQLNVSQNKLQSLDISQNTELIGLVCHSNEISVLDLSQNTALIVLNCYANSLSSLDVSPCSELGILFCSGNNISTLDVSFCPDLYRFYCSNNSLTSLNMKNLSPSTIMDEFEATSNPNLTCIEVDDAVEATAYWANKIDAASSFSTDCGTTGTYENAIVEQITLYPNPATSLIHIEAEINISSITIIDVLGEPILVPVTERSIEVSELTSGIYTLQIQTDAGIATKKFIKK